MNGSRLKLKEEINNLLLNASLLRAARFPPYYRLGYPRIPLLLYLFYLNLPYKAL